ncbi:MAG TPA: O-antigen ligase family protein [Candidatus Acidoferrum sp.]|nr:O-antigen ligase family protein [Candidatus Acidoferrum sp.]
MTLRSVLEKSIFVIVGLILSGAVWRAVSSGNESGVDGDQRTQVLLAIMYVVVAVLVALQFRASIHAFYRNPALLGLLVVACASPLWAEAPDLVLRRALALVGTTLFGVALAITYSFEEQLKILRWALRIGAFLTLILLVVSPSRALSAADGGGGIRGVFPHKNILGGAMALGFLVEWFLREQGMRGKILRIISLCAFTALLVASDSLTSIVTVAAALSATWVFRVLYARRQIPFPVLVLFVMAAVGAMALIGVETGDVMSLMGRSSDMTGRTELWNAVFQTILQRPLLGFGFSGFWKDASPSSAVIEQQIRWTPTYSHNGYLEIALSLGSIGLLLVAWMLASGLKRAWRQAKGDGSYLDSWPLALFLFVVIHNGAECTIAWQNCLEWGVCVATIVGSDPGVRMAFEEREESEDFVHATEPESLEELEALIPLVASESES